MATPAPWLLRFEDGTGRELLALQKDDTDVTGAPSSVPFGRSRLPDGTLSYHLSFAAGPDEQFYGLGERFGTLGRRGSRTVAWIEDALGVNGPRAYKAVPATCRCRRAGRSAPGCRHRSPPPRVRCVTRPGKQLPQVLL